MEQRRLRLGDILDDYCPRERRVTNHAVVAMIEDDVKQTRCTTCDAEHAYKGGREPRRRKKDATSVLYREVLAGMSDADAPSPKQVEEPARSAPALPNAPATSNGNGTDSRAHDDDVSAGPPAAEAPSQQDPSDADSEPQAEQPVSDEGPIHRRLIRATLPRPEGQKTERPLPEFTIRGSGSFRGDRMKVRGPAGNAAGKRGGRRFSGPSGGAGRGPSSGPGRGPFGGGPHRGPSGGQGRGPGGGSGRGRKRSR